MDGWMLCIWLTRGKKRLPNVLQFKLQVVVGCLTWTLETKLGPLRSSFLGDFSQTQALWPVWKALHWLSHLPTFSLPSFRSCVKAWLVALHLLFFYVSSFLLTSVDKLLSHLETDLPSLLYTFVGDMVICLDMQTHSKFLQIPKSGYSQNRQLKLSDVYRFYPYTPC